jgi:hypothetical protein
MKYMKNIMSFAVTILMVLFGTIMTGCSHDDDAKPREHVHLNLRVTAHKGGGDDVDVKSRALTPSEDGKSIISTWKKGDVVLVYYNPYDIDYYSCGQVTADSDGKSTTLSGEIDFWTFYSDPHFFLLVHPGIEPVDYTGQNGVLFSKDNADKSIESNYDFSNAVIKLNVEKGQGINDVEGHFLNQQAIVKFSLKDKDDKPINATRLIIDADEMLLKRTITDNDKHETGNQLIVDTPTPMSDIHVVLADFKGDHMAVTAITENSAYTYYGENYKYEKGKYYHTPLTMIENPCARVTEEDKGKLLCSDGTVCTKDEAAAASKTPIAVVFYVGKDGGESRMQYRHGLAMSLTDCTVDNPTFDTAPTAATSHTPAAPKCSVGWILPTEDQWNKFFDFAGRSFNDCNNVMTNAGGTPFESGYFYWTSTEQDEYQGKGIIFYSDSDASTTIVSKTSTGSTYKVRPIIVF